MPDPRPWMIVVLLVAPAFAAAEPEKLDEQQLAVRVDQLLAARWKAREVVPAPRADDATFIRRAFLDLAGRIPNILEVRDFLDDDRPDKRRIWVDQLLKGFRKDPGGDSYSDHFANVLGDWLLPPEGDETRPYLAFTFRTWLRTQLRDNVPYDEMVRRILLADPALRRGEAVTAFQQALGNQPENMAGAASRLFLGVKLECAQCHDDRSGGNWSREQFWELAAFFDPKGALTVPGAGRTVEARFLDGKRPERGEEKALWLSFARWTTADDNPYFARAAVNRVWAYLFGVGLVEPVDEHGAHNPPSHPELLDDLAREFARHRYDLKYLLRALVVTEAYQRSSLPTHPSQADPRLFARGAVRGLSAEQLFDSLAEATEYRTARNAPNPYFDPSQRLSPREDFVLRFRDRDRATETHTSILQALHLMNGPLTARATDLETNRTLATIARATQLDVNRRLETLFLVVLSRLPTDSERKRLVPYVNRGGPSGSPQKALADIFWVLLNSAEFRLNY